MDNDQKSIKEKAIKKELSKLNQLFKDIPENKKKLCSELIQNAAFQAVTLKELQDNINTVGSTVEAMTGNGFEVVKENPAVKLYTTMINRYTGIVSQMLSMLPEDVAKSKLEDFLSTGDDDD